MENERVPLTREDVIRAVERNDPSRIPLVRAKWWGEGLDGADTLFIEAGGFDRKHGPDWKCPVLVLTRR